jgi:hypothetical protein
MEVQSATYYGWSEGLRTVEKRITYNYEQGNDVTVVERRSYTVEMYDAKGSITQPAKGNTIDQMV